MLRKIVSIPIIPKSDGLNRRARTIPIKNWTPCKENRSTALQITPFIDCEAMEPILQIYLGINKINNSSGRLIVREIMD